MKIPLIKSTFFNEEDTKNKLANFIINSKRLSMDKTCNDFEKKFAQWQGRKYCVMFNSGSSANLAIIQTLLNLNLLDKKDKVGFSAITWATNVMPLIQFSLQPVPIDIEINTLNISKNSLEIRDKKEKLKCLFLTNLLGFSDNIQEIAKYCKDNNIILIEDNCESLGSEYGKKKLGNFGLASTFSFFVGHHMSTIEGGAVCTDDKEVYSMLKMVRSHGWDRSLDKNEQKKLRDKYRVDDFNAKYAFYDIAFNIRPTEIQGFLGINQLKYLEETISKREKNFEKLKKIYTNKNIIEVENKMSRNSNFAFPIVCKDKKIKNKLISKCDNVGIESRPIVGGLITSQPFYKKYIKSEYQLNNSHFINENSFYIGNNPEMTEDELNFIINTLSS